MPNATSRFVPGLILAAGCGVLFQTRQQDIMALRQPLASLPDTLLGIAGADVTLGKGTQRVAGMTSYVLREFARDSTRPWEFSIYVGYYAAQTRGTIHSPKNCLPGAGWEVISSHETLVEAGGDRYRVNRYQIGNRGARAMVYYWYQGRGRISANEYRVKWELLRDKAIAGRSEEALVRIVVPMQGTEAPADSLASAVAAELIPAVFRVLPPFPAPAT